MSSGGSASAVASVAWPPARNAAAIASSSSRAISRSGEAGLPA
jgi:hypothetical protein